jgi:hypothetical protein
VSGDLPRLKFDRLRHPCRTDSLAALSVATQLNTYNRGSAYSSPVMLCNSDQIVEMQSSSDKIYKFATYIYDFNVQTESASVFEGEIDGDGFALLGKELGDGSDYVPWWLKVTGTIKDLGFYSAFLNGAAAPAPLDVVTQNNAGDITNIEEIDVHN